MLFLVFGIITALLSVVIFSTQVLTTIAATKSRHSVLLGAKRQFDWLLSILGSIGTITGKSREQHFNELIRAAGSPLSLSALELLGLQPVLAVVMLVSTMISTHNLLLSTCAGAVGWFYPIIALQDRMKARHNQIRSSLPFVLDLLSICMEAGLNFDSGLSRVTDVMKEGPLKEELSLAIKEMRMGQPRREALLSLSKRVAMPEVSALVSTLVQADQLGTGMAVALPSAAEHLRGRRILAAESAASKAPIKMLFPLIILIFPCLLILLFGPMMLNGAFKF